MNTKCSAMNNQLLSSLENKKEKTPRNPFPYSIDIKANRCKHVSKHLRINK